jgi:copper chaperone
MLRYQVDDLSCGHCVQAVTQAVKGVDPTAVVTIDLPTKRVEVQSSAADAAVAGAIREAGYTPAALGAHDVTVAPKASSCCGDRR